MPISAAVASATNTAGARPSSSTASPPTTTVAAATCPLGVCSVGMSKASEHGMNSTFSASVTPNVAQTTTTHAAAPRRHPCISSAIATASISGTITA